MSNRPEVPGISVLDKKILSVPGTNLYDWVANVGLPAGESNHGLQIYLNPSAGAWNLALDIAGSGWLTWAIFGMQNNTAGTINWGARLSIDGNFISQWNNQPLSAGGDIALPMVGSIILLGSPAAIRGCAPDYLRFEKSLKIEVFEVFSTLDMVAAYQYFLT